MGLATAVFDRCDDSSGTVIDLFHQAGADLGEVARTAGPEPEALARQVLEALQDNGFGQYDGLIAIIAPALGSDGVAHLKELVEELRRTPVPVPPKSEWQAVGWGSGGTRYAHEMEERARQSTVAMALKDIADVQGDVDGFIAQYDPKTRKVPKIAAEIAQRLLAAGRAGDPPPQPLSYCLSGNRNPDRLCHAWPRDKLSRCTPGLCLCETGPIRSGD